VLALYKSGWKRPNLFLIGDNVAGQKFPGDWPFKASGFLRLGERLSRFCRFVRRSTCGGAFIRTPYLSCCWAGKNKSGDGYENNRELLKNSRVESGYSEKKK